MIRRAQLSDLPQIEELLLKVKRRSEYRTVKVEFERARKAVRQCISSALGFAYVAEHGEKLTGVLIGVTTHYWFSADRYATDLAFYSQRRGDGDVLLDTFKAWADGRGATMQMGNSTGANPVLDSFYLRHGLERAGSLYIGEKPINVRMGQLRDAS